MVLALVLELAEKPWRARAHVRAADVAASAGVSPKEAAAVLRDLVSSPGPLVVRRGGGRRRWLVSWRPGFVASRLRVVPLYPVVLDDAASSSEPESRT